MTLAWRSYVGRYYRRGGPIVQACALAVLLTAATVPYVALVRYIFDVAVPGVDWRRIALAGLGMVLLNAVNAGISLAIRRLALKTTKQVIAEIREDLIRKIYRLSRACLTNAERSRLHTRIVTDSERIDIMSNALVAHFLPSLAGAVALSAIMLWLNWKLYAVLFAFAPLGHFFNVWLRKKLKTRAQAFRAAYEEFSRGAFFVLQSVDLARMQDAQAAECERQGRVIQDLRRKSGDMALLDTAYNLSQNNVTAASVIAVLALGAVWVASGAMSIGQLLSFYVCGGLLNSHLRVMLSAIPQIIAGQESLEAVHEILESTETEPYQGTRAIEFAGAIEYRNVSFSYGADPVLRDFSLAIGSGERVALIGPNGSGKSTALHLLCGFYKPESGDLLADGFAYDELDMAGLRSSIAVVMQDPILFAGTIHENIAYGSGAASRDAVREAACRATADAFIGDLPGGYDTPVGDGGVLLSGGQRQKLSIARALLKRPKMLVLDEPTNHLDSASVRLLMRNLAALSERPSILLVSHDLEVAAEADRVYELRNGRLSLRTDLGRSRTAAARQGVPA
jgi:ABC-type multidrug transport system fused ATPase/permease subunit